MWEAAWPEMLACCCCPYWPPAGHAPIPVFSEAAPEAAAEWKDDGSLPLDSEGQL